MSAYAAATTPLERFTVATSQGSKERRNEKRSAFSYRFRVLPAGAGENSSEHTSGLGEETIVIGKDLTERGIGFLHDCPLPYRRVRLVAADPRLAELGLADLEIEVVLRWCRFLGAGRYESGGQIARPRMGAA